MAITIPLITTRHQNSVTYEAAADTAGDVLFTLVPKDTDEFDSYIVLASVGAVSVEVSLNGIDWSNAVALQDMAGTLIDQAAVVTNLNLFGIVMRPPYLRVKASGGAAKAAVTAWASGRKS